MGSLAFFGKVFGTVVASIVGGAVVIVLHAFDIYPEHVLAYLTLGALARTPPSMIVQAVAVVTGALLAAFIFNVVPRFWRARPHLAAVSGAAIAGQESEHRSLADAMRELYEATRQSKTATLAEKYKKRPDDVLQTYAEWLTKAPRIALFDTKPPSMKREQIPDGDAQAMAARIENGAGSLVGIFSQQVEWDNVEVRAIDFAGLLQRVRASHEDI